MKAAASTSPSSPGDSTAGEPPDTSVAQASRSKEPLASAVSVASGSSSGNPSGAKNQGAKASQAGNKTATHLPAHAAPPPLSQPASTSFFGSSWISPSSSASAAASSALESTVRNKQKLMTYEQFRAQEPPQARLLRLRGLFDKLMDADAEHALADGRAKDEWTKSAIRAQYGKFGPGRLPSESDEAGGGSGSRSSSNGKRRREAPMAVPPRPSYANELLTQCRKCREELDRERAKEYERERARIACATAASNAGGDGSAAWWTFGGLLGGSGNWISVNSASQAKGSVEGKASETSGPPSVVQTVVGTLTPTFVPSSSAPPPSTSSASSSTSSTVTNALSSAASSISSLFTSTFGSESSGSQGAQHPDAPPSPPPDHDGEAGWTGSGVWGLSAVGSAQREMDRNALAASSLHPRGSGLSLSWSKNATGSSVAADASEGARAGAQAQEERSRWQQRQIEWEGFLRYAEQKERELYAIFNELDKNGDMRLDVQEIRAALDRAGLDVPPMSLEDFIASLASSRVQGNQYPYPPRRSGVKETDKPYVSFPEFRDYLLLLPRKPSVSEIFRFYQVRKTFGLFREGGIFAELASSWGKHERGASAVNLDGDVSLAGEEKRKYGSASPDASSATVFKENHGGSATDAAGGQAANSSEQSGGEAAASDKVAPGAAASVGPSWGIGTLKAAGGASKPPGQTCTASQGQGDASKVAHGHEDDDDEEEEEDDTDMIAGSVAIKFLLAGGIAGAVSRTATAPFDRLKVYLITTSRSSATVQLLNEGLIKGSTMPTAQQAGARGVGLIGEAIHSLYRGGGGIKAFWVGNGLNCLKIFPESAIKFLSYETSKRAFAKYVDGVHDSRDISGTSRFISGGIGGITSQLAIYPIETLKTRLMSSQGAGAKTRAESHALLRQTAQDMWRHGGLRTYYRGLTAGLIGVFPYSAIDMSTFEGIKLFYIKYTGKDEPGVLALLAFGSISGSVGATTVYPLNLVRTRLQAAGTPGHPATYNGFWDVVRQTYRNEGYLAFYKGLVPTLLKVVPAVSISYVVYEQSKRRLGVHI
ncbi:hypothetical protein K437DRAFT_255514 [Tilletiaria anomala UBC 951]|uniref:EF-hand domain-containing protein n=1 Tax=Tilletiaria anomala (strain ATCC 24038 / CBS 436.72 / UBC 951) TaxID=1037660 RepID=A0A066W3J2_TILAU|nr:uncharacterized protein K437DRAFT_255514 [Tilletiaria anomala UBC 951]KDN48537.1 hypothetical protein K437DRAFT_255514 [Tilletiaria anomala UBC 951]